MKTRFTHILAAMAFSLAGQSVALAEDSSAVAHLDIEVSGLAPASGNLMVAVFAGEAQWDGGDAYRATRVAVDADTLTIALDGLQPGEYGLKMYHDVDADGELDTNMMGIPSEPFAFSNNARGSFGPASWSSASFTIAEGGNVHSINFR
jgi:uncharacterized protein (DUF2141 family)